MIKFTEEEGQTLVCAMIQTWNYISSDALNTIKDRFSREEVFELVVDCDRMRTARVHCSEAEVAVIKKFYKLDWDEKKGLFMHLAFPASTYGW